MRLAIWIIAAFALSGLAQAEDDLTIAAKSPYRLEAYFETHPAFDTGPLWTALGVHAQEHLPLPKCTDSRDALHACSSELNIVTNPDQAIVVLRQRVELFTVYLRFVHLNGEQWTFDGSFEPFVKYFDSGHQILMFGTKPFLLVTGQGQAGSGVSSTEEYWFDLTRPGLNPCLSRTADGKWNGADVDLSLDVDTGGIVVWLRTDPVEQVGVAYHADFMAPGLGLVVSRRDDTVVFVRQRDGIFALDPAQSTVTRKQLHELYEDLDVLSREDFLRYNLADLKEDLEIPEVRDWLSRYLETCKDTTEKRELLRLIRQSRGKLNRK